MEEHTDQVMQNPVANHSLTNAQPGHERGVATPSQSLPVLLLTRTLHGMEEQLIYCWHKT